MFIVSTDRKHIINLDHVQEINIHNTEKSKIMATFASGKPIQIGQYIAPQEAAESFSDLIDAIASDEPIHCLRRDVPTQSPIPNGAGTSRKGFRSVGKTK